MRHLFILVLLLTLVTLNSLSAKPFGKDNEVHIGKVQNKMIRVSIGEDLDGPLAVYLYDKKTGEQLKYKYWKPGRVRELRYDVANYHTKSYIVEVKSNGVTILKKSVN
jgi:hypothetical protein